MGVGLVHQVVLWCMVGVVKRAEGGGYNIEGRGGLQAGMPKADFKGENIEAATRILESPPLLVSY